MINIGLTGGIACGKTTVANYLHERGYMILDADAVSRDITQKGAEGALAIRHAFGNAYFDAQDELDRKKLGALIFSQPEQREKLNALLHPIIRRQMQLLAEQAAASGAEVVFSDIPLLYEIGMDKDCDIVWAVVCDEQTQLTRLMARDGLTKAAALARIHSQMPVREKARRADAVIDTSRGWEDTRMHVDKLINSLTMQNKKE